MAWRWLAESCRTTHEVFATYFAVLLDDANPQLLAGNRVYQGYQAMAMNFVVTSRVAACCRTCTSMLCCERPWHRASSSA